MELNEVDTVKEMATSSSHISQPVVRPIGSTSHIVVEANNTGIGALPCKAMFHIRLLDHTPNLLEYLKDLSSTKDCM